MVKLAAVTINSFRSAAELSRAEPAQLKRIIWDLNFIMWTSWISSPGQDRKDFGFIGELPRKSGQSKFYQKSMRS